MQTAHSATLAPPPPLTPGQDVRLRLAPTPDSKLIATVITGKGKPVSQGGDRTERPVPVHVIADVLDGLAGQPDIYVSTHLYHGWRRSDLARRLCSIVIDLDYGHDPGSRWAGQPPELVAEAVLSALRDEGVPAPNRLVSSGRGLYCQWLLEPVSARAAPRYQAVVRKLCQVLKAWSPDVGASTRLTSYFRVVGSVHSGTGTVVREVWRGAHPEHRWPFDDLAAEVLPRSRDEICDLRRAATERRVKVASLAAARAERRAAGAGPRPSRTLTSASWAQTLLDDTERLVRHRHGGQLPAGERNAYLLVGASALAHLVPAEILPSEIQVLAGRWGGGETDQRTCTVAARAVRAARGERGRWQGQDADVRYAYSAQGARRALGVTDDEARAAGLRGLLGPEDLRRAHYRRTIDSRRRAGVRPLGQVRDEQARRRDETLARYATAIAAEPGLSLRAAAGRLGCPSSTLARWLAAQDPSASGCPASDAVSVLLAEPALPARPFDFSLHGVHGGDPEPDPAAPSSAEAAGLSERTVLSRWAGLVGRPIGPTGNSVSSGSPRQGAALAALDSDSEPSTGSIGGTRRPARAAPHGAGSGRPSGGPCGGPGAGPSPRVTPDPDPPLRPFGLRALRLASVRAEDPDPVRIPSLPSGLSKLRLVAMRAETPTPSRRRRPRPDLRDPWPDDDPPALSFPVPQPDLPEPEMGTDAWWTWFDATRGLIPV